MGYHEKQVLDLCKQWSTNMPLLMKVARFTDKPILELGGGFFSTPLLHWLCCEDRRGLFTYENSEEFMHFLKTFRSKNHRIRKLDNWDDLVSDDHWGIVFIDHDGDRAKSAIYFKDKADFVIIHDSNVKKIYGYENVWEHFKYRYDWDFCSPWTTVLSNRFPLDKIKYEKLVDIHKP